MKYKMKIVDGHEVRFSSDWIGGLESEIHFNWYFHQASLVYSYCDRRAKIMEIGVGTSLLSDLLRRRGWAICTLDIDEDKGADFCGSAESFRYGDHSIQTVLAFEIFEHIPFDTFTKVVRRLSGEGVREVFFSLPWNEKSIVDLDIKIAKIPRIAWSWNLPGKRITTETHFWELAKRSLVQEDGKQLIPMQSLVDVFAGVGYEVAPLSKVGCIEYFSAKRE